MRSRPSAIVCTLALLLLPLASRVAVAQRATRSAADSMVVVATAARFHDALATADSAGALALLADSVLVLESGDLETRAAYRSHHLAADIEFARAIRSERTVERVAVVGDAAWVIATSRTRGTFGGRTIDSAGAELMVLVRTAAGWRIAAIHWSSHARRPSGG